MITEKEIREINAAMRKKDESHLWPINGRFNATERAIRRVRKLQRDGLVIDDSLSYESILDNEISDIVNHCY